MAKAGEPLSDREIGVLERLVDGSTNREIAQDLDISHNTVKVHLRNIFTKLDVSSRTEAITVAMQRGLITVPGVDEQLSQAAGQVIPASSAESLDGAINGHEHTSRTSSQWRIIAAALFVIVLLLAGVLIVPRLIDNVDEAAEGSTESLAGNDAAERIGNSDWYIVEPMPRERASMALVSVGLDLYQIGGEVNAGVVNLVDVYETTNGRWRSGEAKPTAVAETSAAVLFGEIYVPGGRLADGQPTSVVEAYSPVNDAWRPVAPLPKPVAGGLTLAGGGQLYLFGGWDGQSYLNDSFRYDPNNDSWTRVPSMSIARMSASGGALSDGLYVVGGYNGQEELAACEFFDPIDSVWSACPEMHEARSGAGAAVLGDNRLFVVGGGRENPVSEGEVFDNDSARWQLFDIPMLDGELAWHDLGLTNVETRIYALGGRQGEEILSSTYIYAPFIHQTFLPAVGGSE